MKTLFKLLFLTLILTACYKKEYRYEIRGRVYIPTSGTNPMHDAIWYTDTINKIAVSIDPIVSIISFIIFCFNFF